MENSGAVGFEKVKVFAADPWYKAQPGSIKNIEINVKGNMNIVREHLTTKKIFLSGIAQITFPPFSPIWAS